MTHATVLVAYRNECSSIWQYVVLLFILKYSMPKHGIPTWWKDTTKGMLH